MALLLAIAVTMPACNQSADSMSEIPLGSGAGGGGAQVLRGGAFWTATMGSGGSQQQPGPEAAAFDGTYVWVATQFNNSVTRIRASDGAVSGTFAVGKRPVALLYAAGSLWVANLLSNNVTK